MSRIGAIYGADWYLSECSAGIQGKRCFDIFYGVMDLGVVCNQTWLHLWKRVLHFFPFPLWGLAAMVDKILKKVFKDESHVVPLGHVIPIGNEPIDKHYNRLKAILAYSKPHLSFTAQEEAFGQKALRELGIAQGRPFVCFHARDSAYLGSMDARISWDYHDYRDSSIEHYIPGVEDLVKRGYCAIRMGAVVKERLKTTNPAIIDYALNGKRTDFLDIYLSAKCEFFICSDAGICIVPEVFRRPTVYTNWTLIKRISPWVLQGIFIFKKFYLCRERRLLTFSELMDLEFDPSQGKIFLRKEGIELIENSPEEIKDTIVEMEQRLKGTWQTTQEDKELQERFWGLFGPRRLKSSQARIGAKFLQQHKSLLS